MSQRSGKTDNLVPALTGRDVSNTDRANWIRGTDGFSSAQSEEYHDSMKYMFIWPCMVEAWYWFSQDQPEWFLYPRVRWVARWTHCQGVPQRRLGTTPLQDIVTHSDCTVNGTPWVEGQELYKSSPGSYTNLDLFICRLAVSLSLPQCKNSKGENCL